MKVRALHLCTSVAWGGLELYACTLMAELVRSGIDVTAVCAPGSKAEAFLKEQGIEVLHFPNSLLVSPSAVRFLRRIIRDRRIDAVHVHFHRDIWPASLALRGDGDRTLVLGIYLGVPPKRDPLHRMIFSRVDAFVTSSVDLNRRLPDLYAVPPSRVYFVPYGRDLRRYTRDEARRASLRAMVGAGDSEIMVGTMVRIDPGKGVMDFAESYAYIEPGLRPGVRYLIAGEPTRKGTARPGSSPFEEHCEAYLRDIEAYIAAQEFRGRISLVGYQEDLIGALSAMDIFVFPSRDELFSLVVLDAMGMGLPVIAAAAGGNLAQIEDGVTGLLYRVADSRDLAGKLLMYLKDPSLRLRHGRSARAAVERTHSMDTTIDRLLEIYSLRRPQPVPLHPA
jgi:glycosyltransferase involved in cell wall biosynthesis